jgi:hypothetical protein
MRAQSSLLFTLLLRFFLSVFIMVKELNCKVAVFKDDLRRRRCNVAFVMVSELRVVGIRVFSLLYLCFCLCW